MRRRGLTLLETVVATFLFLLVIVLVCNLFPSSLMGMQQAELKQRAERLAQSRLNEQRLRPFADLVVDSSTPLAPEDWDGTSVTPVLTVKAGPNGGSPPRVKKLAVTVTWQDHGITRTAVREVWVSCVPR